MSFIELTRRDTTGVTVNTDHIATFATVIGGDAYVGNDLVGHKGDVVTEITLGGAPVPSMSRIQVTESYDEVRRRLGLDWLRCGETYNGDICDRRLDEDSRCPIHGRVGL